jgi:hypothetical protein
VRGAAVDERGAELGHRLGDVPRPSHVRLFGVVGIAVGQRATCLSREKEDLAWPLRQQLLEERRPADIGRLDPCAACLETGELLALRGVPVIRQDNLVAGLQRKLRELGADVARPQDEERTFKCA